MIPRDTSIYLNSILLRRPRREIKPARRLRKAAHRRPRGEYFRGRSVHSGNFFPVFSMRPGSRAPAAEHAKKGKKTEHRNKNRRKRLQKWIKIGALNPSGEGKKPPRVPGLFTIGPSKRVDAPARLRYNTSTVATAVKTAVVAGEMAKGGKNKCLRFASRKTSRWKAR